MNRPIFGKKSPMNGVADLSRSAADFLVAREERRTGSRMVAYVNVARSLGISVEWLRKFISPNEAKEPRLTIGFKIFQVYRQVCERVEQAGDRERELKEEIDAVLESAGLLVAPAKGTNSRAAKASNAHRNSGAS